MNVTWQRIKERDLILNAGVICVSLLISGLGYMLAEQNFGLAYISVIMAIVSFLVVFVLYEACIEVLGAIVSLFRKTRVQNKGLIDDMNSERISQMSLDEHRKSRQEEVQREIDINIKVVQKYARKELAFVLTDDQMTMLCENVRVYILNEDFEYIKDIGLQSTDKLTTLDISHFGWNMWNYKKVSNQNTLADFLKRSFPNFYGEKDLKTIKSHLKDDELKGVIKINQNIQDV